MRAGAPSGRVAESDGAPAQAVTGPRDFGPLGRCTDIGVGARRDRFSTIDKRGRRCLRERAHGLGEWPRAMVRRGRLLPDLTVSAAPMLARILAWVRDATDFRPSITGVGGACASGRTVWESGRERWRDGACCYRTLGFGPPSVVARILAWAREGTDFRPSINGDAIVNVEHLPHAVHTSTRSGTSTKDVIRASPTLGNWKSESEPTPRAAAVRRYDPQPC